MNNFGPKQIRVVASAEQEEKKVSEEGETEKGNEILNR